MAGNTPVAGKESAMPVVHVQITREQVTKDQKAALIKGMTQVLKDVLDKPESLTHVIISEVDVDNWGVGGLPALEYRRHLQEANTRFVERK
jgi:4-oxalocrotonate tautomerase